MKKLLQRFRRSQEGSATIETLIWLPIFIWVLVTIINVSFALFEKNQALRIVQNANRILSTGYMQTSAQVETYVAERLATIAPNATVSTVIDDGVVTTDVIYPMKTLFLPHVIKEMANIQMSITAQHFMEY